MTWVDLIAPGATSLSAITAAGSFIWGVRAWKSEYIGKQRIELIQSVLALFYEAEDAINAIRSPFSFQGEGESRQSSPGETDKQQTLFNRAHVISERYQKHEKLFAELHAKKYQLMATFGQSAGEPCDDLRRLINDIFISARMLASHYWQRQGEPFDSDTEFKQHLDEMQQHQAVFWDRGEDKDDPIRPRIREIIRKVETIANKEARMQFTESNPKRKK